MGSTAKCSSAIQNDMASDTKAVRAGTKFQNIVTKPLSPPVTVKGDLIENAAHGRGDDRAGDHQGDGDVLGGELEFGAAVQDQHRRGNQDDVGDEEVRGDRGGLLVFREPSADEGSAQRGAYRHRAGVDPATVQEVVGQLAHHRPHGLAELAPRDRHRPDERAQETTEKHSRSKPGSEPWI